MAIVSRRSQGLLGELTAVTSFNEIAMLRPLFGIRSVYSTTIIAKSDCDLYCLSNTDMVRQTLMKMMTVFVPFQRVMCSS